MVWFWPAPQLPALPFASRPRISCVGLLAIVIAAGIFAKAWNTVAGRYQEVSLAEEYQTCTKSQGRGYYFVIAKAIAADRWLGVGLNNWSFWVSNEYGPNLGWHFVPYIGTEDYPTDVVPPGRENLDAAQAAPAHNLGALTVGELGIPGLILFAVLWLRWFQMGASFLLRRIPDPMHRLGVGFFFACWGIFLQSLTEWVYRQTAIFFTFNIILGALAGLYHLKRGAQKTESRRASDLIYSETGAIGTAFPEGADPCA